MWVDRTIACQILSKICFAKSSNGYICSFTLINDLLWVTRLWLCNCNEFRTTKNEQTRELTKNITLMKTQWMIDLHGRTHTHIKPRDLELKDLLLSLYCWEFWMSTGLIDCPGIVPWVLSRHHESNLGNILR